MEKVEITNRNIEKEGIFSISVFNYNEYVLFLLSLVLIFILIHDFDLWMVF